MALLDIPVQYEDAVILFFLHVKLRKQNDYIRCADTAETKVYSSS